MNNKTLFYGLLVVGGVFAYYAWKQHSLSAEETSENGTSSTTSSSSIGTFVDDVPVNPNLLGVTPTTSSTSFVDGIKGAVSQVIEPLIGATKQTQLTGQGNFADA